MSLEPITKSDAYVGGSMPFQARVVSYDGTGVAVPNEGFAVKRADVSSITCTVYDLTSATPGTAITPGPIISNTAISDTLTADALWAENGIQKDAIGRNFLHVVLGSFFSTPNHTYRILYALSTTGNATLIWGHEHTAVPAQPS